MRRLLILMLMIVLGGTSVIAQEVNGDVSIINGVKVIRLWGTHYERGYAQGYLVPEEVMATFNEFCLEFYCPIYGIDYEMGRQFYLDNFTVEQKYVDEANGLIDGITASGYSLYNENLGRELDYIDILVTVSVSEFITMPSSGVASWPGTGDGHCSSLSSWGRSTLGDPDLNGKMVVTRNLDFPIYEFVPNYSQEQYNLTVHYPEETEELNWLEISCFPGMIGSISSINEKGFAIFSNSGTNHVNEGNLTNLYPTALAMRNFIEIEDGNNGGTYDLDDFISLQGKQSFLFSSIITCVAPDSAIIVETDNGGTSQRSITDNTEISGHNLAATNFFRELHAPKFCERYSNIADSLKADSNMSIERSWDLMGGAAGVWFNIQKMEYIPALKILKYAIGDYRKPAYKMEPATFNTDFLFSQTPVATHSSMIIVDDNLHGTAQISNPLDNQMEVQGVIRTEDNTIIDSVLMFDDGLHDDGDAADQIYGNSIALPAVEGFYSFETKTINIDSAYVHNGPPNHFTTAGPLVVEYVEQVYPDGELISPDTPIFFNLHINNMGTTASIKDVTVHIQPLDTNSIQWGDTYTLVGDIAPGETKATLTYLGLRTADCEGGTPIQFKAEIKTGGVAYWEEQIVLLGHVVGIDEGNTQAPLSYSLKQNYPNPFNPTTTIQYSLPEAKQVKLTVFDMLGQEVTTLQEIEKPPGNYEVQWNGTDGLGDQVSTGVYFCRLNVGNYSKTIKMVLLR